ncbi:Crp/Fnr family transcriptional regulator [Flammeovirga sp. MY04]|uniref:Crp/Fnr family transcriptional regulator n=1 Tax=Flammeovirga sp. MY04 TaxID=1191459 RepID=UPI00080626F8|nr:Crp/Fnr family transcriptional regulator [Flammeovirga sp. MY04]ANQ51693.1 Crp/Fnr family transcriptional regulator [Flammeovirga sp. MY04]
MHSIKETFTNRYALSEENFEILRSHMSLIEKQKGELILKEGQVDHSVYFIEKGAVRSYYFNKEGKDVSVWFGFEGDIAVSLGNFIHAHPSLENIELLEDTTLLKISNSTLQELYATHIDLANFGRRLAEQALLEMEQQIFLSQTSDAKTRYHSLIDKFPGILQRVKLGHIASYLGLHKSP